MDHHLIGTPCLLILLRWLTLVHVVLASEDGKQYLRLVHDSTRRLEGGKFAHFHVPVTVGPTDTALHVELESLAGDADLYITPFADQPRPTYLSYSLKSTTFGLDVVNVPRDMKRPLAIGVYAHPFHETCTFRMRIYIDPYNSVDEFTRIRLASSHDAKTYEDLVASDKYTYPLSQEPGSESSTSNERNAYKRSSSDNSKSGSKTGKSTHRIEEKSSWITTLILHILEFLVEVFL